MATRNINFDLDGHIRSLFLEFVPTYNPTGAEAELLEQIVSWARDRDIECVGDPLWGLWFQVWWATHTHTHTKPL